MHKLLTSEAAARLWAILDEEDKGVIVRLREYKTGSGLSFQSDIHFLL